MNLKNYLLLPLVVSYLASFSQKRNAKDFGDKYYNWYNKDVKRDKINGVSVEKAYSDLLKNKQAKKTIIVAVVDGGVDPLHEDLKNNMWINPNEIGGNGIDDDKNGYIDDIYGWNFLGNAKGDNIDAENLESTRWYRELRKKYQTIDETEITNKKEYALYKELDKVYWDNRNKYKKEFEDISQAKFGINFMMSAIANDAGKEIKTIDEAKQVKTDNEQTKEFISILTQAQQEGLKISELNAYFKQSESFYKNYYNLDFNPRSEIIGDDITDINDNKYGNPDVKGPDSFHGTFCAGIIGATRKNNIGIDGIANVKIMGVRAVPGGDEYDKDVALAIRYAVDNGANIINMSFGKDYSPQKQLVDDAIAYANKKGVLLVHAAGNDSKNVDTTNNFPDDHLNNGTIAPNILTVGASSIYKNKKMLGVFSNYGKQKVDLFAPGVDIVSTAPDNFYKQGDGTSFAAPVVSGVAALVWSYHPELTHIEVKNILLKSVKNYNNKCVQVPDREQTVKKKMKDLSATGGVVNAYNAVKLAQEK